MGCVSRHQCGRQQGIKGFFRKIGLVNDGVQVPPQAFLELLFLVKPAEASEGGCLMPWLISLESMLSGMVQLFPCLGLPEDIFQIAPAPLVHDKGTTINMRLTC